MTTDCLLMDGMNLAMSPGMRIQLVDKRRDLERFIRLPASIYRDDPHWVHPLLFELRNRFCPKRNPFYEHADVACFLAERDGRVVGRISAQVCELAQASHGVGTGHFGFFECEDRVETARSLFQAAEGWLKHRGMTRLLGPFDLTINDQVGILVEGFDSPPYVMMGHHRPSYDALMTDVGLQKEMDVHAYFLDISRPYTDRTKRIVDRASNDRRITIRPIDKTSFRAGVAS